MMEQGRTHARVFLNSRVCNAKPTSTNARRPRVRMAQRAWTAPLRLAAPASLASRVCSARPTLTNVHRLRARMAVRVTMVSTTIRVPVPLGIRARGVRRTWTSVLLCPVATVGRVTTTSRVRIRVPVLLASRDCSVRPTSTNAHRVRVKMAARAWTRREDPSPARAVRGSVARVVRQTPKNAPPRPV